MTMTVKKALADIKYGKAKEEDFIFDLSTADLLSLHCELDSWKKGSEKRENQLVLSKHAISRIRERIGGYMASWSDDSIALWFRKVQNNGTLMKARMKFEFTGNQLLNHKFIKAEYMIDMSGHVYVVIGKTVMTVHNNESGRWEVAK